MNDSAGHITLEQNRIKASKKGKSHIQSMSSIMDPKKQKRVASLIEARKNLKQSFVKNSNTALL
jgi:hypothetical protein